VRVLGEHVELIIECEYHLWNAVVDPSQLENAILNLVINARDAMPQGGRLTVEASNTNIDAAYANQHSIASGDYVMIAISDNGSGISPNVISRVFEPFFTTKDKGKGTGLGLAMVYGFIKQTGGHVNIYSEVDIGTTVKMYLSRADAVVSEIETLQDLEPKSVGETILLVEDDILVRTYASGMLNSLGYKVIEAGDGRTAYEMIKSGQAFDLLFTDVVMPGGMTGKQLADKARLIRPDLKVLYTSGYTESVSLNEGRLDSGELLLSKPYKLSELAQKIRLALA
jgi:CheY-like chemotaxis protein